MTLAILALSCHKAPAKEYPLRGEVVGLEAQGQMAMIRFEKIDGWMEAMTMEFHVKNSKEFHELHAGEKITGTVFVTEADYWISDIHPQ